MSQNFDYQVVNEVFDRLFPLCRSVTGPGLRESLQIIKEYIPLQLDSVPSGTPVFDWTVPPEWRIRKAFLRGPDGRLYADLEKTNLSVVNYSEPVDMTLTLSELQSHLHSIPELPTATPYVTSYYKRSWGFCVPHNVRREMPEGKYHAFVDSEFVENGTLDYGHIVLPGDSTREVMLTSYLCHPSLANNELSGPLVLMQLFKRINSWHRRRYTYRFVLAPETIGSICYLSKYGEHLKSQLAAGLVLTCLGGRNETISFKTTRRENTLLDRLISSINQSGEMKIRMRPFTATGGSDERQFCSAGFNLPMGQMARDVYGEYDGYHNSLDDKDYMNVDRLIQSATIIEEVLKRFEYSGYFRNTSPFGEPQLGRRGLYPNMNSHETRDHSTDLRMDGRRFLNCMLTVLNYSDGHHSMIEIAQRCEVSVNELIPVIDRLEKEGLLIHEPKEET
jgi:aminopeptidase-like protein